MLTRNIASLAVFKKLPLPVSLIIIFKVAATVISFAYNKSLQQMAKLAYLRYAQASSSIS
jgi:hypothetical protein